MTLSVPPKKDSDRFDDWIYRLWKAVREGATSETTSSGTSDHTQLTNLNSNNYYHLSSDQFDQLTNGGSTSLHRHDADTPSHPELSDLNSFAYYHLTYDEYTDLTDGNETTLHKHDHALQANLNSNTYYHLTSTERSDLLGASYLTLDHLNSSLTGERILAVGTGLTTTDGGAGGSFTINQAAFVGDSGSGGYIGAVPAPAAGDGTAGSRAYLSGDGTWRNPATAGDIRHDNMTDIEGGIATGVFESTAFETTAFQQGVTEYFHVDEATFNESNRIRSVLTTAIDATLDDDSATCIVTASAKTITLPTAIQSRIGYEWTIVQNCNGYVDIAADVTDEFILPGGSDTIRLDQIGSVLTVRCVSTTQWVIV